MSLSLRFDFHPDSREMSDEEIIALAADNMVDAVRILNTSATNIDLVTSVLGHDMWANPVCTKESLIAGWRLMQVSNGGTTTAYVCGHCRVSSLKELWGPGRITCPKCGRMADVADGTPRP